MKTIYLNGDSHTCGTTDVINPNHLEQSYASHLAHKINYRVVQNPAVGGASNDRIFRLTEKYLWECERGDHDFPDFMLIGWSEVIRFDWFINGNYVSLGQAGHYSITHNEDHLSLSYDEGDQRWPERFCWQSYELTDTLALRGLLLYNYQRMFNLHCRLEYLRIPHLFLNAHLGFMDVHNRQDDGRGYDKIHNYFNFDWDDCFWNVLDKEESSFVTWSLNRGYGYVDNDDGGCHPHHEAHLEFADVLYNYIIEHDILNRYRN